MSEESRARFAAEAREERPDLAMLCLLMGFEVDLEAENGGIDEALAPALGALERLASVVRAALRESPPGGRGAERSASETAAVLAGALAGSADLRGGPGVYQRLESSLLHQVLRRGRGLPITVSTVWIAVGRMVGLPVYGVALPGHFVVGVGDPEGEFVLVDAFRGGQILSAADAAALVAEAGYRLTPDLLRPAEPQDVVLRTLANIRNWASARPEHARTQLWATELSLLLPRHPAQLRLERAELLVRTGHFLQGAAQMEEYATILDAFDPESAKRVRAEAKAARFRLN
ncbi:transglutaminase-like domain-containing protein [Streptacidiphilus jiangxiensis]|uniref:Regulator of sirC expression, contains transglutaminase-like and TPR domains n=1 Tax=Streptacidiphilus jiangxiensis TaxID=235985 RepID=A0A1H7FTH3_STRJI|nr:transglutaminase-like domain-containing protein [Streptacidiphilus jiangxiensis]SEK28517.1 Regulator of sirC expression, contains transglutaminase-like and TPR domains [Streptacidiphilus jiangxiensis]